MPAGTSCENDTVCDGIATCDGQGRCVSSAPPSVDDGNACTVDSCDTVRGPLHQAIDIDDGDSCTLDACDPRTGKVSHEPIDIDDGDDCTFDSCDPKAGVQHQRIQGTYTCDRGCGEGFHAASRAKNSQCGDAQALQTFCTPNCGPSFYSCDASCPKGYRAGPTRISPQCGSRTAQQVFCLKN